MSYKSPKMDGFIEQARDAAAAGQKAKYDEGVKGFLDVAFEDIPRIPLYQPYSNVAMQKNISGYQYGSTAARLSLIRQGLGVGRGEGPPFLPLPACGKERG